MSRVLVTGATGLIGARLVAALGASHEVFAVTRTAAQIPGVTNLVVDLATDWPLDALPARMDAVVHLAQSDRWQDFPGGAADVFAVNLASTVKLLDFSVRSGSTRFVLASTGGLYGSVPDVITERTPLNVPDGNLRFYFESKRAAEHLALAYAQHLQVSILRPFFVYGPGQRTPKLVPRLVERVRTGMPVRLRGECGTMMNPTHVDDVADTIRACLATDHAGIINVAGGQVTNVREMTTAIAQALDTTPVFEFEPGDADRYVVDTTVMQTLIGRVPAAFDGSIAGVVRQPR